MILGLCSLSYEEHLREVCIFSSEKRQLSGLGRDDFILEALYGEGTALFCLTLQGGRITNGCVTGRILLEKYKVALFNEVTSIERGFWKFSEFPSLCPVQASVGHLLGEDIVERT